MRNLLIIVLAVVGMMTVSCEKVEYITEYETVVDTTYITTVDTVNIGCECNSNGLALLAKEGRVATQDGIIVEVVCDTLFTRTFNQEVREFTEYFYYTNEYGNNVWCNPKYLVVIN